MVTVGGGEDAWQSKMSNSALKHEHKMLSTCGCEYSSKSLWMVLILF
jgi:hypothetical protein